VRTGPAPAGKSGLVVPRRDPEALAEALERLATDPALRRRLSSACREAAASEIRREERLARFLSLYERLSPAPR
jgi:glycosyltransferase involved in cell wall biosynthesis